MLSFHRWGNKPREVKRLCRVTQQISVRSAWEPPWSFYYLAWSFEKSESFYFSPGSQTSMNYWVEACRFKTWDCRMRVEELPFTMEASLGCQSDNQLKFQYIPFSSFSIEMSKNFNMNSSWKYGWKRHSSLSSLELQLGIPRVPKWLKITLRQNVSVHCTVILAISLMEWCWSFS